MKGLDSGDGTHVQARCFLNVELEIGFGAGRRP